MSALSDLVPSQKDKKAPWAKNLSENIDSVAAIVGLDTTAVSDIKDGCKEIVDGVNDSKTAETAFANQITSYNNGIEKGVKVIRKYAKQIKGNVNYTDEIGKKLGIVGPDSDFDPHTYKSKVKAVVEGGHVHFSFRKQGVEGVNIYSRPAGTVEWEKLTYDTHSPYIDNRPLAHPGTPEKREYMCYGVLHSQEIGQPSDIVSVVFGG